MIAFFLFSSCLISWTSSDVDLNYIYTYKLYIHIHMYNVRFKFNYIWKSKNWLINSHEKRKCNMHLSNTFNFPFQFSVKLN